MKISEAVLSFSVAYSVTFLSDIAPAYFATFAQTSLPSLSAECRSYLFGFRLLERYSADQASSLCYIPSHNCADIAILDVRPSARLMAHYGPASLSRQCLALKDKV